MNRIWSLRIHLTSITTPLNFCLHKVYIKSLIQKLNSDDIVKFFANFYELAILNSMHSITFQNKKSLKHDNL